jgi:hypothetical protein
MTNPSTARTTFWRASLVLLISLSCGDPTGGSPFGTARGQDVGPQQARWAEANRFEGRYAGQVWLGHAREAVELQVSAEGQGAYRARLSFVQPRSATGGTGGGATTVELAGILDDYTLVLEGALPVRLQFIHGRFTALDDDNNYAGHVGRVAADSSR